MTAIGYLTNNQS